MSNMSEDEDEDERVDITFIQHVTVLVGVVSKHVPVW